MNNDPTKRYAQSLRRANSSRRQRSPGLAHDRLPVTRGGSDTTSLQNHASQAAIEIEKTPRPHSAYEQPTGLDLESRAHLLGNAPKQRKRGLVSGSNESLTRTPLAFAGFTKDASGMQKHPNLLTNNSPKKGSSNLLHPKYVVSVQGPQGMRSHSQRSPAGSLRRPVPPATDSRAQVNVRQENPLHSEQGNKSDVLITFQNTSPSEAVNISRSATQSPHTKHVSPQDSALDTPDVSTTQEPDSAVDFPSLALVKQPESLAISQSQLADEVKVIYAGLVMVEAKCINVVNAEFQTMKNAPNHQQGQPSVISHLQGFTALHRTLLHEHHDFLLASQHPSASAALKGLAAKYSMPGRMWKHGIHSFLELLRHYLPYSMDYMLAFIYLAYQMIALLYETVPSFKDTWIECLGDLGRYRMAIEDDDQRDRDIWTGVSRYWYCLAVDRNWNVGRLYHHLAILSRNSPQQQLSLYCRALVAVQPFASARDSIITLFDPILARPETGRAESLSIEIWIMKAHALLFNGASPERYNDAVTKYLSLLANHIGRVTSRFKEQGSYIALSNISALLLYGSSESAIWRMFHTSSESQSARIDLESLPDAIQREKRSLMDRTSKIGLAWRLAFGVFAIALTRLGDINVLPTIHLSLVFLLSLGSVEYGLEYFTEDGLPWDELAVFLTSLSSNNDFHSRIYGDAFPLPDLGDRQPLPEDYMLRGMAFAQNYFPSTWFEGVTADEDERMMELPSTAKSRMERVMWLGLKLCSLCPDKKTKHRRWLTYSPSDKKFGVSAYFDRHCATGFAQIVKSPHGPLPIGYDSSSASRKLEEHQLVTADPDIQMRDIEDI